MTQYNIQICYNNENRTFTLNSSSKIADIVHKSLLVNDLSIDQIGGIYFFFLDTNVYLNDSAENKLNLTIQQFYNEYGSEHDQFTIDMNINNATIEFRDDYKNYFNNLNPVNAQTYFYRPEIHIINNYNQDEIQPQNNTNLQEPTSNPPTHNNENTTSNENTNNNGYAFEFNYNYDPNRRQFYLNQQQSNSPFNDIMRSLGNSVLQSINNSRNNQNRQQTQSQQQRNNNMFGTSNNLNSYVAFFDTFQRAFSGETDRHILRSSEIDRLPCGTYADLKNNNYILQECTHCVISLEEFRDDSRVIALPCKHAFKENMIRTWLLNSSNKCPTCRAVVAEGFIRESGFI